MYFYLCFLQINTLKISYWKNSQKKYLNLKKKLFNKNEFYYFMIFRFAGGGGTPFAIQNLLPALFNMKVKKLFFSTLIGLFPMVFILSAMGSGIESIIQNNMDQVFYQ